MSPTSTAIYDYIVRELAPTDHEPDEAQALASTLQAKVKGLCHLEFSGAEPT